jgi:ABC-type Zn2+ transport system substrate-binding protein/surface adhesin
MSEFKRVAIADERHFTKESVQAAIGHYEDSVSVDFLEEEVVGLLGGALGDKERAEAVKRFEMSLSDEEDEEEVEVEDEEEEDDDDEEDDEEVDDEAEEKRHKMRNGNNQRKENRGTYTVAVWPNSEQLCRRNTFPAMHTMLRKERAKERSKARLRMITRRRTRRKKARK